MRNTLRSVLPKIALLAFGLFIAVLLIEPLARLAGLKKDAGLEPQGYYVPHPDAGYVITDNFPKFIQSFEGEQIEYWSNQYGCYDKPYDATNEPEPFALLVGDSFTWGFTGYEKKWGTVMEEVIGQRILKCGVNGYGTKQELSRANDVIVRTGAKPKVLVVGYFYNDLAGDHMSPSVVAYNGRLVGKKTIANIETGELKVYDDAQLAEREGNFEKYCKTFEPAYPLAMRGACFLNKHSVLYPYVKEAGKKLITAVLGDSFYHGLVVEANPFEAQAELLSFIPESTYPWLPQAWEEHLGNLGAMRDYAARNGMELVVTLIPYKAQVYPALAEEARAKVPELDFAYGQKRVTEYLDQQGITYVDLTGDFAAYAQRHSNAAFGTPYDLYWTFDGHWNPRGNQLAGLLVTKALLGYDFTDIPADARVSALAEAERRLAELE